MRLGLRWICISFAISIKIASVLAEAHGIIEWLVCIMPWCWCYQFFASTSTKIRPASLKIKGSDKHLHPHSNTFYNRGNGRSDNHYEVLLWFNSREIFRRHLKDRHFWRSWLKQRNISCSFYVWLFLSSSPLLEASTSSICAGEKTAIDRKDLCAQLFSMQ